MGGANRRGEFDHSRFVVIAMITELDDIKAAVSDDALSMIQTGLVPLHPGAVSAYRMLHG